MKRTDAHRCDACANRRNRCEPCRAARRAVRRDLIARKLQAGICLECTEPAIPTAQRCAKHHAYALALSRISHAHARARGDE